MPSRQQRLLFPPGLGGTTAKSWIIEAVIPRRAAILSAALAAFGPACAREAAAPRAAATPAPSPTPGALVRDALAFTSAVDALAAEALERGPVAGLSIAVFERGLPVLAKGYGFTDVEAKTPATAETSYPIASVSKRFTAALILRLADQGKLGIDDPLSRFFPGGRARIGALTIRHLLAHTSGLTRGGPAPRWAARRVLTRGGTAREQGEAWDYSNYNFSLLGLVIEQVTGRDYAEHVRAEIVEPLGLAGTGYCEDGSAVPGRGRDYLSVSKRLSATDYWTTGRFFASGGVCSTVLDLVSFERALEGGRIVSSGMLREMRSPAGLPELVEAGYGLGTRLGFTGSHRKIGHTGGGQGNKAVVARYPDDGVTIAVLLNTERPIAEVTANGLEERIAGLVFAPSAEATFASPDELQRYAGQYRVGSRVVQLTPEAGALMMRPGLRRRAATPLVDTGGGAFVVADDPSFELRFLVQDDRPRGYALYRNGWFEALAVRSAPPTAAAPGTPVGRN
jgi:CubicO group peptidase (beta-lactamase class C family)